MKIYKHYTIHKQEKITNASFLKDWLLLKVFYKFYTQAWRIGVASLLLLPTLPAQDCIKLPLDTYHSIMAQHIAQYQASRALAYADSILMILEKNKLMECEKAQWILFEKNEALELNKNYEEALKSYYSIIRKAEKNQWYKLLAHTHISIARCYENIERPQEGLTQLNTARNIIQMHRLDTVYARFCLRYSSYHRIYDDRDSALIYAQKAIHMGEKYQVARPVFDGYLLMGILSDQTDTSIFYFSKAVDIFIKNGDFNGATSQVLNIVGKQIKAVKYDEAFTKLDHARSLLDSMTDQSSSYYNSLARIHEYKRIIFEKKGLIDSAYVHLQLSNKYDKESEWRVNQQIISDNAIEFEVEKEKEKTLYLQKITHIMRWVLWALVLSMITFFVLLWKNHKKKREISEQNRLIHTQNEQLEKALNKQSMLLSEVHHRVKNNLQLVISLLILHGHKTSNKRVKTYLDEISRKVFSIALIHEQLYRLGDFEKIDTKEYINELTLNFQALQDAEKHVEFSTDLDQIFLNLETVLPLGIICSELISNSLKHGVTIDQDIKVNISLKIIGSKFLMKYSDNGPGFPANLNHKSNLRMGFSLIDKMVRQLHGESNRFNENGAVFTLLFEEKIASSI